MASSANRSTAWAGAAAAVLSGAAWWFGTGLHPQPWLAWLAPLPLLLLAPAMRWQHAALAALCAGACAGLNLWHYLLTVIGLPLPVGVIAALGPALTFALALLLFRRLLLLRRYALAAVAFPALWVTMDFVTFSGSPHGSFGSLAYSQLDVLPFVQFASLAGIWGVAFLLLLAPAALAVGLLPGPDRGRRLRVTGVTCLLFFAWDFGVDGRMHSRMAVMRGIESGFAVARAALRGNLTLSDNLGRIVAETSDELGHATLIGELPLHNTRTLYARWGDWFAWFSVALLGGAMLAAIGPRPESPPRA
nr:hypothetical protein [uncultured Duganella sp.]